MGMASRKNDEDVAMGFILGDSMQWQLAAMEIGGCAYLNMLRTALTGGGNC